MVLVDLSRNLGRSALCQSHRFLLQRNLNEEASKASFLARDAVVKATTKRSMELKRQSPQGSSWWTNAELWGFVSALTGWTMSLAAIYDSQAKGAEVISLNMTGVLIVYSSLFLRWSFVVRPQNLFLAGCHFTNICAQLNQMKRALEHKLANNKKEKVIEVTQRAVLVGSLLAGSIVAGPIVRKSVIRAPPNGFVRRLAKSDAGPFTVHFWAPMSKWLISGASLVEYDRPIEKISITQYSSLTLCGMIQARYALLVIPTNYMLFAVNVALFLSSGWHLGRKVLLASPAESAE